jgi:hypothetical protein
MTTPAQQTTQTRVVYAGISLSRVLLFIGTALFVVGAFAAGGHPLGGVPVLPWWGGAFAAWMLAGAV